jgi:hypothetical protein
MHRRRFPPAVLALILLSLAAVTVGAGGDACAQTPKGTAAKTAPPSTLPPKLRDKLYALGFPRYINPDPRLTADKRDLDAIANWRTSIGQASRTGPLSAAERTAIESQALPAVFGSVIGRPSITKYGRVAKFPSRREAEESATFQCQVNGGEEGCGRGITIAGEWCVGYASVAAGANSAERVLLFSGYAKEPTPAKLAAVANCRGKVPSEVAQGCSQIVALCADGRE